jgi:hypothetical protein
MVNTYKRRKKMIKRFIPIRLSSVFILGIFSVFVFLSFSAFAACPDEMSSYWKLDEGQQGLYSNEIDPDFEGECADFPRNCPTPVLADTIGGAQVFSSNNQTGIDVPPAGLSLDAPFDWGATDSFTIEYWIKREPGITGNEVVVGRDDGLTNLHWWTGVDASGVASFQLRDLANQGPPIISGTTNVADGQWHHIVAVRNADLNRNLLYVDGIEEASANFTYTALSGGFVSPGASLNIGWLGLSTFFHFNGIIDEVALYDFALPPAMIQQHAGNRQSYCEIDSDVDGGAWYLDFNGNDQWDPGADTTIAAGSFGLGDDIPITGDWNGDGITKIGVFRNGAWYLDFNGNGQWDPAIDTIVTAGSFGLPDDIPITGDWNGDGITNIGVFRNGAWYLDINGNYQWDPGVDLVFRAGSFGLPGDIPVTGDWNGDGLTNIGVFRNGAWYLDATGNGNWDPGADLIIRAGSFGLPDDIPVTGDWNGDGLTDVGVFRNGAWYLDFNGNRQWDPGIDKAITAGTFGLPDDIPITGDWNGDDASAVGVFRSGN